MLVFVNYPSITATGDQVTLTHTFRKTFSATPSLTYTFNSLQDDFDDDEYYIVISPTYADASYALIDYRDKLRTPPTRFAKIAKTSYFVWDSSKITSLRLVSVIVSFPTFGLSHM